MYPRPAMIALQGTPTHPPNELFLDVLPTGGELPERSGENRIELNVMGITQIIVAEEERSDFCLLYMRTNMGCGLRGACA